MADSLQKKEEGTILFKSLILRILSDTEEKIEAALQKMVAHVQ